LQKIHYPEWIFCYTTYMPEPKIRDDERYIIDESKESIFKAQLNGKPDKNGIEYRIIEDLADGYTVYAKIGDPSQPSPNFFIHKKYILNRSDTDE
jgi:hypothetical protein